MQEHPCRMTRSFAIANMCRLPCDSCADTQETRCAVSTRSLLRGIPFTDSEKVTTVRVMLQHLFRSENSCFRRLGIADCNSIERGLIPAIFPQSTSRLFALSLRKRFSSDSSCRRRPSFRGCWFPKRLLNRLRNSGTIQEPIGVCRQIESSHQHAARNPHSNALRSQKVFPLS